MSKRIRWTSKPKTHKLKKTFLPAPSSGLGSLLEKIVLQRFWSHFEPILGGTGGPKRPKTLLNRAKRGSRPNPSHLGHGRPMRAENAHFGAKGSPWDGYLGSQDNFRGLRNPNGKFLILSNFGASCLLAYQTHKPGQLS